MRRAYFAIGLVVIALSTSSALAVASGHKPAPRCPPQHGHVIVADAQAQVYVRPEKSRQEAEIYGCAYGGNRSYLLGGLPNGDAEGGGGRAHYTLAGVMLATESFFGQECPAFGHPKSETYVEVENLRTGRLLHKVPTGTNGPSSIGLGPVTSLVLKSDGAVAWIARNEPIGESATSYEVHAVDRTGQRLLAAGVEIAPGSLALAGSTLYWTQGSKPMSTVLHCARGPRRHTRPIGSAAPPAERLASQSRGAQELADLKATGEGFREQVLANVSSVIAHRQNVPESAELIAAMAGTRPAWITTEQTHDGFLAPGPSGRGTRRRGYEYELHPSQIKRLPTGVAAVIAPGSGQAPTIALICHP